MAEGNTSQKSVKMRLPPFLIGVAGGTASGKSTVCEKIMESIRQLDLENVERQVGWFSTPNEKSCFQVVHISQDSFYKELKGANRALASKGMYNFDHPDALDNALMERCLRDIIEGRTTKIPVYDFKSNCRVPNSFTVIQPLQVDVVLFEGILTFYNPEVRSLLGKTCH